MYSSVNNERDLVAKHKLNRPGIMIVINEEIILTILIFSGIIIYSRYCKYKIICG